MLIKKIHIHSVSISVSYAFTCNNSLMFNYINQASLGRASHMYHMTSSLMESFLT